MYFLQPSETCLKKNKILIANYNSLQFSKEQLNEIRQLRIQGKEAHKSGDHEESEKLLKEALQLLDS